MAIATHDSSINVYDIEIDGSNFENDVMRLFSELRPQWKRDEIQTKVSQGTFY